MAITAKLQRTARCGGLSLRASITRTGTDFDNLILNLPKGIAGTMTARASSAQATFTLATTRHGIIPGMKVDMRFGNNPTAPIDYLNCNVVSIAGNVIVLNTSTCIGTSSIPDLVGTSVVVSQQTGFDLSKISDTTQVKVLAYQSVFGSTINVPSAGVQIALHSANDGSEPPHTLDIPRQAKIVDSESRFVKDRNSVADFLTLTNYLYGTASNPSATQSASVHFQYLLEDLGS